MIDDIFVFDCVVHCVDLSDANLRLDRADTESSIQNILAGDRLAQAPENAGLTYRRKFDADDVYAMVFEQAPTDMAMVQVVPQFEWFKSLYAPVELQHELAARHPDRVLFCGGVDPIYRGLDSALQQLEYQVNELGARSIKFYNGHIPRGWSCDDRELAYPLYEKARDLGIRVLQFHKGVPFGQVKVEEMRPNDLQAPARDFPDMVFVIHHLALPYVDEAISIASRFPNIHLALSANLQMLPIAPRLVQDQVGKCLQMVGSEKLLYGSEAAPLGGPLPYLKAFLEMEIPGDMREGYGYPQITRHDKERILGLNFAQLMGVDVEEKKRQLGLLRPAS